MNYEALGRRIRQQRKILKMTQEELAAASDVSTSYIGHIERGLKHCSLETLIAICNTLKITPNQLLQDSCTAASHTDYGENVQLLAFSHFINEVQHKNGRC